MALDYGTLRDRTFPDQPHELERIEASFRGGFASITSEGSLAQIPPKFNDTVGNLQHIRASVFGIPKRTSDVDRLFRGEATDNDESEAWNRMWKFVDWLVTRDPGEGTPIQQIRVEFDLPGESLIRSPIVIPRLGTAGKLSFVGLDRETCSIEGKIPQEHRFVIEWDQSEENKSTFQFHWANMSIRRSNPGAAGGVVRFPPQLFPIVPRRPSSRPNDPNFVDRGRSTFDSGSLRNLRFTRDNSSIRPIADFRRSRFTRFENIELGEQSLPNRTGRTIDYATPIEEHYDRLANEGESSAAEELVNEKNEILSFPPYEIVEILRDSTDYEEPSGEVETDPSLILSGPGIRISGSYNQIYSIKGGVGNDNNTSPTTCLDFIGSQSRIQNVYQLAGAYPNTPDFRIDRSTLCVLENVQCEGHDSETKLLLKDSTSLMIVNCSLGNKRVNRGVCIDFRNTSNSMVLGGAVSITPRPTENDPILPPYTPGVAVRFDQLSTLNVIENLLVENVVDRVVWDQTLPKGLLESLFNPRKNQWELIQIGEKGSGKALVQAAPSKPKRLRGFL